MDLRFCRNGFLQLYTKHLKFFLATIDHFRDDNYTQIILKYFPVTTLQITLSPFAMSGCPFRILRLPMSATAEDVTKQWKRLLLENHPDKCCGATATEVSKCLNDAKERAIAMLAEREDRERIHMEISEHLKEVRYELALALASPFKGIDVLLDEIKKLVAEFRLKTGQFLTPSPEIAMYYHLCKQKDDTINMFVRTTAADKEKIKNLESQLHVEHMATEEALAKVEKLQLANIQALKRIDVLQKQLNLPVEKGESFDSEIEHCLRNEASVGQRPSSRVGYISDVANSTDMEQAQFQQEGGSVNGRKKRARVTEAKLELFKPLLEEFIRDRIEATSDGSGFVTTQDLKSAFDAENQSGTNVTDMFFFKHFAKELVCAGFPKTVISAQLKNRMGYKGLLLKYKQST